MACSINTLREKEVIDVNNGKRIGFVCDFLIDPCCGHVTAIVLPSGTSVFSLRKKQDMIIGWERIVRIGEDAILVNAPPPPPAKPDGDGCEVSCKQKKHWFC